MTPLTRSDRPPNREKPRQISQGLKSRELSFYGFMSCSFRSAHNKIVVSEKGMLEMVDTYLPWSRSIVSLMARLIKALTLSP